MALHQASLRSKQSHLRRVLSCDLICLILVCTISMLILMQMDLEEFRDVPFVISQHAYPYHQHGHPIQVDVYAEA